ncbi:MAG: Na+/H+ antiporter NhaC family protein [Lachnospirales bacterium]
MLKRKIYATILLTLTFVMIMSTCVFADDGSNPADVLGMWTLLPPLIAIILAFLTKNVVISLFIGALSGTFLISITNTSGINVIFDMFTGFVSRIVSSLADPWNAGIVLQVLVIGGIVHLIGKMGGAKAVAEKMVTRAKTPRSAQFISWIMGILLFFDDYANSLIVGPIMRPIFDKMKISRSKLAFIVDATAAPIAGIALISTWIGLEIVQIRDAYLSVGIEVEAYSIFIQTIPYRFYNIFMLGFVALTAYTLKEFGPMLVAERNARAGIHNDLASSEGENELEPLAGVKPSVGNALIPIGTLVVTCIIAFYFSGFKAVMGGDDLASIELLTNSPLTFAGILEAFANADASVALLESAIFTACVTIGLGVIKKIFTLSEAIDTWIGGMKNLLITGVILLLAWALNSTIKDLGTALYLSETLGSWMKPEFLPSIIFLLGSLISFSTGTAYGTISILMPLAIPLAISLTGEADLSLSIVAAGAVLTGAIFGDHCSPISDTTILSSMGAGCNHIEHVRTQIWYAVFVGIVSVLLGYLPAGFGVPFYITLPVGIIAMFIFLKVFGKSVEE